MKTSLSRAVLGASTLIVACVAGAATPAGLPARPEEIQFKPLEFQPPKAADFRRTLSNGVAVYMLPSSELPLVTVTFSFRPATHLEPEGKYGLAGATAQMMRRGGTTTKSAEEFDEQVEFLAAAITPGSVNALTSNFDEAFALFIDMLRNPGFDEAKFKLFKDETLEAMKQRNDNADTILEEESARLMWGEKHPEGRQPTKAMIDGMTVDDLRAFHKRVYHPGNLIIGVTGDFKPDEMLAKLDAALSGWEKGESVPDPVDTDHAFKPGLYHVEKDIPQGKFIIAQRGIKRDDPDAIPVSVMNEILGAGGFTSRLMKKIRSDEGLTYGISSNFASRVYYPGEVAISSFSKNSTVALTARFAMEEVQKMRTTPVTESELATAKAALIETFPRTFESKQSVVNLFINDEWTKRDPSYWETYRDRVRAVDAKEVQRVAQTYLDPAKTMMLVVGKWNEIKDGDPNETRESHKANMSMFYEGQPANPLPLRDPMTLEPIKN